MEFNSLSTFVFFAIFLSLQLQLISSRSQEDKIKEVNAFLEKFNLTKTISYKQVEQWFYSQIPKNLYITEDLYPRLFPFCVDHNQITNSTLVNPDSHLYKFRHVFKELHATTDSKLFYHFNPSLHSVTFKKDFIKNVALSRINTPEPDMVNLRQWIHIQVETVGLQGLYVQSLAGPIGLPMGDFNLDFPCNDLQAYTHDIARVGQLNYCHYRPKASIYHPKVYVGYSSEERVYFHMHFHWTDITCLETPYIQFLMIGVKNILTHFPKAGVDFDVVYSPVFLNTVFDSIDGSPYPYYPKWKEDGMFCGLSSHDELTKAYQYAKKRVSTKPTADKMFAKINWQISPTVFRIQPNEEYDACIRGINRPEILKKKDESRLECPPGPFQCSESYAAKPLDQVKRERDELVQTEADTTDCFPCTPPPCKGLKIPSKYCPDSESEEVVTSLITQNDTNILENFETVVRSKSHGMLASLSCLVLLPMANYMARHYKEVCRNCLLGNGPWIFLHVILHLVGAVVLWVSVGPVISSISNYGHVLRQCQAIYGIDTEDMHRCAVEKSVRNPHVPLGILVFVLQNLLVVSGFFRSSINIFRFIQLIIHSHVGYLTFIIAGISAIVATYNNRCVEIVGLMSFLCVLPVVFFIIGCVFDVCTDTKVGIIPRRKQWPILEPVKLDRRGPLDPCKWCVLIVFGTCLLFTWFMIVASSYLSSRFNERQRDLWQLRTSGSLSSIFSSENENASFRGLFGFECGRLSD